MTFVCLEKLNNSFKILINSNEIKYISSVKTIHFQTWEQYILNSISVRSKTYNNEWKKLDPQPPLENNNESSNKILIPGKFDALCPISLKGDWLKVAHGCLNKEEQGNDCKNYLSRCENKITGWIKWKEGNKLLIKIHYLM